MVFKCLFTLYSNLFLLNLFKIDNFQPTEIVKSIVPKENTFLFFEVSDRSFHQVAEVLSKNKTRLSIHGWFHGAVNYRPVPHIEIMQNPKPFINIDHDLYFEWLIEKYLDPVNQMQIRKKFEKNSEIRLEKFLNVKKS
jgi:prolyl 3-hydroxylase /prolyl 3,4-dihydroxylase